MAVPHGEWSNRRMVGSVASWSVRCWRNVVVRVVRVAGDVVWRSEVNCGVLRNCWCGGRLLLMNVSMESAL